MVRRYNAADVEPVPNLLPGERSTAAEHPHQQPQSTGSVERLRWQFAGSSDAVRPDDEAGTLAKPVCSLPLQDAG